MKLIYILSFLSILFIINCSPSRRNLVRKNRAVEEKVKVLLKWYDTLVKTPTLHTYVFETKVFNKKDIPDPDFDYIFINPSWCFDEDACAFQADWDLVKKAKRFMIRAYGEGYDSLFLKPELEKAYTYLKSKDLKYHNVWLQVPVQKPDRANVDSILKESYLLSPKLPAVMPDDEFRKIFKTSYEDYDRTNRLNTYYNIKREWVKYELFQKYYAQAFENISELVESDRYNPKFKMSDLPGPMLDSLKTRFNYLKSLLPDSLQQKISSSTLKIGYLSQPYLAPKLYLENFGQDVYISPLLIRAAVISGLLDVFEYSSRVIGFENPRLFSVILVENYNNVVERSFKRSKPRKSLLSVEMDIFYPSIQEKWRTQFDFVLLHEVGHIIDKKSTEEQCDCFAINILKRNFPKVDLGIFNNLVFTYKNDYWGRSDDKLVREVFRERYNGAIKMSESPKTIDCLKIAYSKN
ncbi:hypothetical protein [uncultured Sphingobacterium sp.]|uniref:hypothetical protein n=1 Tax=uncultured Sphingobacterium sp. TaxID=182688 RepID=UPI0025F2EA2B|nr:hypothetical protein [uncultured Sphingobacterium sp.]